MNDTSSTLLATIRQLAAELHTRPEKDIAVTLDSSLERDLGIDSLGRVELLARIEQVFGISLPEQVFATAETARDLLQAVLTAVPDMALLAGVQRSESPVWVQAVPADAMTLPEVLDWHVRAHPDRTHITLQDADSKETAITYAALRDGAEEIAAGLLERELQPGQSVAIMLPTSREYFCCFFGDAAGRRGTCADLPACPTLADRGSSATASGHTLQCNRSHLDNGFRGKARGEAASGTSGIVAHGCHGG